MDTASEGIRCEWLGAGAAQILRSNDAGRVLMSSTHAIYLEFNDELIMLCDVEKGRISFALEFRDFERLFTKNRNAEGTQVLCRGSTLSFCGINIVLPAAAAQICTPSAALNVLLEKEAVLAELVSDANKGFLPLLLPYRKELVSGTVPVSSDSGDRYAVRAAKNMAGLFSAMRKRNGEEAGKALLGILGLGPGLTPSTDDWTVGLLHTLYAFSQDKLLEEVCNAVLREAHIYTNSISCAYLENACKHREFEMIERLLHTGGIEEAERLMSVGSSSGSDMLCGYLFALSYLKETFL